MFHVKEIKEEEEKLKTVVEENRFILKKFIIFIIFIFKLNIINKNIINNYMDFNFSYDIYPHPPMFCNNDKTNKMNQNILERNTTLCPDHEIQLDCRSSLTRCSRYNDNRDNLPSSCNYVDCNKDNVYTSNTGYYKHYFNNIDIESELLLAKPALPECKTKNNMTNCLEEYAKLEPVSDPNFFIENPQIWNNNTKRKIIKKKSK